MGEADNSLTCKICNETVLLGDDYRAHLFVAHNVTRGYAYYMAEAEKRVGNVKREPVTLITIDDEEEQFSSNTNRSEFCKSDFTSAIQQFVKDIVKPIHDIITVNSESTVKYEEQLNEVTLNEETQNALTRLEEKAKNIPDSLIHQLLSTIENSTNGEEATMTDSTLESQQKESQLNPGAFMYKCSENGCNFVLDKLGMQKMKFLKHLTQTHNIPSEDIRAAKGTGRFKFTKQNYIHK